jgi:hypothetical protein
MKADVTALTRLAAEKARISQQESKLLADLRGGLEKLGYRLVPIDGARPERKWETVKGITEITVPWARTPKGFKLTRGKPKPFTCAACGRSFERAMHLGRHRTTVHAKR